MMFRRGVSICLSKFRQSNLQFVSRACSTDRAAISIEDDDIFGNLVMPKKTLPKRTPSKEAEKTTNQELLTTSSLMQEFENRKKKSLRKQKSGSRSAVKAFHSEDADSFGSLDPEQTARLVTKTRHR